MSQDSAQASSALSAPSASGEPLVTAVLRVRAPDGTGVVGAGFLVTDNLAVTCAHVVRAAVSASANEDLTGQTVTVDLPLGRRTPRVLEGVPATVEQWAPEPPVGSMTPGDVAVLRLGEPMAEARPVVMAEAHGDLWDHAVRTFGFPARYDAGVWHAGVLRGRNAHGWLQFEQASGNGYGISQGFSGAPVWDDRLAAVVGMVVAGDRREASASLMPLQEILLAVPSLRTALPTAPPFKGLLTYQEADSDRFHGRRTESEAIRDLVDSDPVVTVLGPSGCGKSSLVRAGVVPLLRQQGHAVVVVRPQDHDAGLLSALALALARLVRSDLEGNALLDEARAVEDRLCDSSGRGLADIVAALTTAPGKNVRALVIVVDQLEELLTQGPTAKSAEAVTRALLPQHLPTGLHVLTTLRADFLEVVSTHPGVAPFLRGRCFLVPPMSREQLVEVINGPLRTVPGVGYEGDLAQRLLDDADAGTPGVLPLLGFTLEQLWKQRQGGLLTSYSYRELGGVGGALREHAEAAWQTHVVRGGHEQAARRLFTRLVRVPLGTSSPVRQIVSRASLGADEWVIAERLAAERLLVLGTEELSAETVELAHEALIHAWDRLKEIVERDREFLTWREGVRHDRERWENAGRPDDLLPTASALKDAARWERERGNDLDERDIDFLRRGRHRQRLRTLRRHSLFVAIGTALALAGILGGLFLYQTKVSADRAADSESRALASASADVRTTDPALSVLLSLAAYRRAPTEPARDAVLQNYLAFGMADRIMSGTSGAVQNVAASHDGSVVLAVASSGQATVFVRGSDGTTRQANLRQTANAVSPVVAPDGRSLGYVARDGRLVLHQLRPTTEALVGPARTLPAFAAPSGTPSNHAAAMSSDHRRAMAVINGYAVQWNLDNGTVSAVTPPRRTLEFRQLWYGAGHSVIASVYDTEAPVKDDKYFSALYYPPGGEPRTVADKVTDVAVSGDGTALVTCKSGGWSAEKETTTYQLTRISDGARIGGYRTSKSCIGLAADQTARRIAVSGTGSNSMALVDTQTGTVLSEVWQKSVYGLDVTYYGQLVERDGTDSLLAFDDAGVVETGYSTDVQKYVNASSASLFSGGRRMAAVPPDGQSIRVYGVDDGFRQLASAARSGAEIMPQRLEISYDDQLMADPLTRSRILIRALPSLRKVSEIRSPSGTALTVLGFTDDRRLVTSSGATVDLWDGRTGQRVASLDLRTIGLDGRSPGSPAISLYPKAGCIVVLNGDGYVHVASLTEKRELKGVRVKVGSDAAFVGFNSTGQDMLVSRQGGTWELWRSDPPDRELGPMRSFQADDDSYVTGWLKGSRKFLVAAEGRVRVYRVGLKRYDESYDFGTANEVSPNGFLDASGNGPTVVYTLGSRLDPQVGVIRLDPRQWEHRLCSLLDGRELTGDERPSLPEGVPSGSLCSP